MNTNVVIGESRRFHLQHAVFVYGEAGGPHAYVTVHDAEAEGQGPPRLGPGRPADLAFLRALSESLQTAVPPEILPECVLCRTPDLIVWWSPAVRRPMYWSERTSLGKVSGTTFPQPALVWKIEGRSLVVRALRENQRPTAKTKLCVAPYWNTNEKGLVCLGDMRRPGRIGVDTLRGWEDGYFGSLFTGQNGGGARIRGRGGLVPLWRGLARSKGPFPTDRLVDAGETLGRFIKGGRDA